MFWRFGESHVLLACSAIIQNQSWHCQWFIILLDIVSKLLCTTIWSSCAVSFESEQTPFPQALSIQICCFAQDSIENILLCSYVIFLIRDQWMIERLTPDWAKWWVLLWSATTLPIPMILFHWKFHFTLKKVPYHCVLQPEIWLLTLELIQDNRSGSMFSSSLLLPAATAAD